jgi:hypothetical protein
VVDDFGIQYVKRDDALHLSNALGQHYETSKDWSGSLYCGITLDWNYEKRTVDLSMPGYVETALHRFQHKAPAKPQDCPYKPAQRQYNTPVQLTEQPDDTQRLDKKGITTVQQIVGTFLFYARAVDNTMLPALNALGTQQANATEMTQTRIKQFLDYCASHKDATIRYRASDMELKIHSDAAYLVESKARSREGGHFYMGNKEQEKTPDINNGAVHTNATLLKVVVSSAAEAEVGALFGNTKIGATLRTTLEDMGHPQPATIVITDNTTASGIVNDTIKQRRSRAFDMRYYWVRDRIEQGQFKVIWQPAAVNMADYFTKHHTAAHHRAMRPIYLYTIGSPTLIPSTLTEALHCLRGCVDQAGPNLDQAGPNQ